VIEIGFRPDTEAGAPGGAQRNATRRPHLKFTGSSRLWPMLPAMEILLVTTPGCLFCDNARDVLVELAAEFPLTVREVDALAPEGLAFVERDRPAMWPLVLADGEPFSSGRLPRTKLRRLLERAARIA